MMKPLSIITLCMFFLTNTAFAGKDTVGLPWKSVSESKKNHPAPPTNELCSAFMIYDVLTRKLQRESMLVVDWSSVCKPLAQYLSPELCPSGQYLENICNSTYKVVHLNPSVKHEYCQPLFEDIESKKVRKHCVGACINFVSRDRGDCCKFECD